jgi:starch synthase
VRILHVASEVAPFAQSGGLADVVAGLPQAQAAAGDDVAVVVPLYRGVSSRLAAAHLEISSSVPVELRVGASSHPATLRIVPVGSVRHVFVECPALFDRPGTLYGPGGADEWSDNHVRFAALGRAALAAGPAVFGAQPDVLHVHDWQAGLAAVYARLEQLPVRIVATIHNLAYRGIFPKHVMDELGLPWSLFTLHQLEFWDQVSFLKGGLAAADAATTVSPSYAQEILTPELGEGLEGFLRHDVRRLVGIVNGIDTRVWDPSTDPALAAPFSRDRLDGKAACRAALAREVGLTLSDDEPLIGVVARMTGQKGLDLVAEIVPELHRLGARLVVLGAGEPALEDRFRYLAEAFSQHVVARIGFDVGFSRRIYAGCDLFVMPSRFEPCGLGQLYAMRYGTIPIVHAVGGLRDTVVDPDAAALSTEHGTGFSFAPASRDALLSALERAISLFRDRAAFARLRYAAMSRDSSWTSSARQYAALYASLVH